jgi:hypothetical protein
MKRVLWVTVLALLLMMAVAAPALAKPDTGFDQFGYNDNANLFVGTGMSWGLARGWTEAQTLAYYESAAGNAGYAYDKLVMKWNDEWDRGNAEGWTDPNGYDAWCTNQWIGTYTGENEHFKCIWVGADLEDSPYWRDGGYSLWGQFEAVFDRYHTVGGKADWWAKAVPAGLGGILK